MQTGSIPDVEDYYGDLDAPNPADLALQLEELVQQGSLSPEQAQTILLDRSDMNNVSTDPRLKENQMAALAGLQDLIDSGGMTGIDKANMSKIANEEASTARGAREAILQNAQSRGLGGSGLELMSQLQNQQDAATRTSQRDMDVTAQAQQRALEALMQQGQLSGQMQAQDFGQQSQIAQANDAISKFNAQNQQNQVNLNTAARNDAAAKNLGAKQAIADANVGTRNAQQQYNKNLIQQNFENELKKRGGQTGVSQANAQAQGANSQAQANANNQNMSTAITAGMMFASDERCKENLEEFDPSDFLDSLTGYKFNYKDQKHGVGRKAGVMAQDLLKSEVGSQMVEKTPDGLAVNAVKATGPMLAGLASLNKRLKDLEGEK